MKTAFATVLLWAAGVQVGMLSLSTSAAAAEPVGLGIYVADGVYSEALDSRLPSRLTVVDDGRQRYLSELDIVQSTPSSDALGFAPAEAAGTFAQLDWSGTQQVPCHPDGALEDWRIEIDGVHFMRSRCYRGAAWMDSASAVVVVQRDASGHWLDARYDLIDSTFWERRLVGRVVSHGCNAIGDCSAADTRAEALIQLRGNLRPALSTRTISAATTKLEVWLITCGGVHQMATVPIFRAIPAGTEQPSYGLHVQLAQETPTPTRGYFVSGERVTFRATFTDGDGHRLHQPGQLPSYGAVLFGNESAFGLRYLTFTDDPVLYWAHKNTQSDMTFTIAGPLQDMHAIGSTPITPAQAFLSQIPTATVAADGWSGAVQIFPPTTLVFPCLASLASGTPSAECFQAVTDTFTMEIPADARPGTWLASLKARRVWRGEPVQAATSVKFPVGQAVATSYSPHLSGCARCHTGQSSLAVVGHGFGVGDHERPECLSCHTSGYSSWFEPDAGLDKRLSFSHLLSQKFFDMGGCAAEVTW